MSDSFDPYHKWLGIPAQEQPPHHYRLLGLQPFESDSDVIMTAVDGRMALVKQFQAGQYSRQSQQILNEIATAKVCLLNMEKKAEYDLRLRARFDAEKKSPPRAAPAVRRGRAAAVEDSSGDVAAEIAASFTTRLSGSPYASSRRKSSAAKMNWKIPAAIAGGALVVLAVVLTILAKARGPEERIAANGNGGAVSSKTDQGESKPVKPVVENPASVKTPERPSGGQQTPPVPTADGVSAGSAADDASANVRPPSNPVVPATPPKPPADDPHKGNGAEAKPSAPVPPAASPKDPAEEPVPVEMVAGAKKPAIPSDDERKAAEKKVNEIFQKELTGAKGPKEKVELAAKLAEQARATKDDLAAAYVLLCRARDLALAAGDVSKAIEYAEQIGKRFDADVLTLKADVLDDAIKPGRFGAAGDAGQVAELAGELADGAIQNDDFDMAQKFAKAGLMAARKLKDAQLQRDWTARETEIKKFKAQHGAIVKAQETLAANPDDAEANLAVGRWLCLVKNQWEKGLPLLKKGSDANLAELAARDLESPEDAKQKLAIADAWYALAEKDSKGGRKPLESRALKWYEESLPNLSGLDKTRVEKRVEGILGGGAGQLRRGVFKAGNVALASNGAKLTTAKGSISQATAAIDGKTSLEVTPVFAVSKWPCEWVLELPEVYELRQIRVKLYDGDPQRFYNYVVQVSPDGRSFVPLADRSTGQWQGWQVIDFPHRAVKAIKLIGTRNSVNEDFHVMEIEAYCLPPKTPVGQR